MGVVKRTYTLFEDQDTAVAGDEFVIDVGGTYAFMAQGTFDGATVSLYILGPNGTAYIPIENASFTADGVVSVDLPTGATVRAALAGGTDPEDIYASLSLIG